MRIPQGLKQAREVYRTELQVHGKAGRAFVQAIRYIFGLRVKTVEASSQLPRGNTRATPVEPLDTKAVHSVQTATRMTHQGAATRRPGRAAQTVVDLLAGLAPLHPEDQDMANLFKGYITTKKPSAEQLTDIFRTLEDSGQFSAELIALFEYECREYHRDLAADELLRRFHQDSPDIKAFTRHVQSVLFDVQPLNLALMDHQVGAAVGWEGPWKTRDVSAIRQVLLDRVGDDYRDWGRPPSPYYAAPELKRLYSALNKANNPPSPPPAHPLA